MMDYRSPFNYFSLGYALRTQDLIIQKSGGKKGVIHQELLKSILGHLQNDDYYPELTDKMAHLVFGINKSHIFSDGNKRSSIALSSFFLEINGFDEFIETYTRGMEEVVIWIAKSLIDQNYLRQVIAFLLYDDDFRIYNFISESKKYRPYIEPERAPISQDLLQRMIDGWLSEDMIFDTATQFALLDILTSVD